LIEDIRLQRMASWVWPTISTAKEHMPSAAPVSEGFIPFRGFRILYRIVGDLAQPGGPAKFSLLVLHGGPGESHDYLQPLER
jgi:hypothetical protein